MIYEWNSLKIQSVPKENPSRAKMEGIHSGFWLVEHFELQSGLRKWGQKK